MKLKFSLSIAALLFAIGAAYAQSSVGIGTESPNQKAVLELIAINGNQGFLAPRLTSPQRADFASTLTAADNGMLVFDSDEGRFYVWYNAAWNPMGVAQLVAGAGISVNGQTITNTGDTDATNDITITTASAGDVLGRFDSLVVSGLKGLPLDSISPSEGFSLVWNGSVWKFALTAAANQTVVPNANLLATNTQAALEELQVEILSITTGPNTIGSDEIIDGAITNADINATAAIAGSKVTPDFGAQNVETTGTVTAASFVGNGSGLTGITATPGVNTVGGAEIVDGAITNADINAAAAISGTKVTPNFGAQNVVTTGTVTAASFAGDGSALTGIVATPGASSVGSPEIIDASVAFDDLNPAVVDGITLASNGTSFEVPVDGISSAEILDGTISDIDVSDISAGKVIGLGSAATLDVGTGANNIVQLDGSGALPAVDGSLLTNLPAGGDMLQSNYDTNSDNIVNAADQATTFTGALAGDVTGTQGATVIANGAVSGGTGGKIADNTITSDDIAPGSIGNSELLDLAVTGGISAGSKIAFATIEGGNLVANTLTANEIGTDAIGADELADGAVDGAAILDGSITNADIDINAAIDGTKIDPDFGGLNITTTGVISAASFSGDGTSLTGVTATGFSGTLTGDVTGTQGGTVVSQVGGVAAASVASGANAANAATDLNTAGTIVTRDASGNFSAGTITANLAGNATTAINFTGALSGDVTGAQGATQIASGAVTDAMLDKTNIPLSGFGNPASAVNMGGQLVTNLATPVSATDAVTKGYVDLSAVVLEDAPNGTLKGGVLSGDLLTSGQHNVLYGRATGGSLTTESFNTMMGWLAGPFTTSSNNAFYGYRAGVSSTTGSDNTYFGYQAGEFNDTGSNNVAVGSNAGPTSGSTNFSGTVSIGASSTTIQNDAIAIGANTIASATNAIAIGANTTAPNANTMVLGNGVKVGIGTNAPVSDLQINDDFHLFHFDNGVDIEGELIGENLYGDGTAIRYSKAGPGSLIYQAGGEIQFLVASSQAAGVDALDPGVNSINGALTLRNSGDAEFRGAVEVGDVQSTPVSGMIRFDGASFAGYDGVSWNSFSSLGFPVSEIISDGGSSPFYIENTGGGGVAQFTVNNTGGFSNALTVTTNAENTLAGGLSVQHTGLGPGAIVDINNTSNAEYALFVKTNGTSHAGRFEMNNALNTTASLSSVVIAGGGPAIEGTTSGSGQAASFSNTNSANGAITLSVNNDGLNSVALFQNTNTATSPAVEINNNGSSSALDIQSGGNTTRFGQHANFGGRVSIGHFSPDVSLDILGTDAIKLPGGTTAERPAGVQGMVRYNFTNGAYEVFDGGSWVDLVTRNISGDVQATGEFTYSAAKTHYASYSSAVFRRTRFSGQTDDFVADLSTTNFFYFSGVGGGLGYADAGVNLPDGAIITEVTAWVVDNDAVNPVRIELLSQPNNGGTFSLMASAEAGLTQAGVQTISDNTIFNNPINNSSNAYFLRFTGFDNNTGDTGLFSARITYTVIKAD